MRMAVREQMPNERMKERKGCDSHEGVTKKGIDAAAVGHEIGRMFRFCVGMCA